MEKGVIKEDMYELGFNAKEEFAERKRTSQAEGIALQSQGRL